MLQDSSDKKLWRYNKWIWRELKPQSSDETSEDESEDEYYLEESDSSEEYETDDDLHSD